MDPAPAIDRTPPVNFGALPDRAAMSALFTGASAARSPVSKWLQLAAISATMLAGLALLAALYAARPIVLPIAAAFILSALLAPIANALSRLGFSDAASGGATIFVALAALAFAVLLLDRPAIAWLQRMPAVVEEAQTKLVSVTAAMTRMRQAGKVMEEKISDIAEDADPGDEAPEVIVREETAFSSVAKSARSAMVQLTLTFVLAYFFLATRTSFRVKAMAAQPTLRGKRQIARLFRDINGKVGEYILTMTIINAGLACVMTAAMMAIGMPSPVIWGALAGLLNFIPYLGPVVMTGLLAMAGLVGFESPELALLPAGIYVLLNFIESNIVTPSVIGVRMMISPLAVIIAIAFLAWLWGPVGAVLAVPLLVVVKTICDSILFLRPLGVLLGEIEEVKGRRLRFCRIEPIPHRTRPAAAAAVERHIAGHIRRTQLPQVRERLRNAGALRERR